MSRDWHDGFKSGVCAALALVAAHDQETIWREIVAECGSYRSLRAHSAKHENLKIDGFARYRDDRRARRSPEDRGEG